MDKERYESLIKSPSFKTMKEGLEPFLGDCVWWFFPKLATAKVNMAQTLDASGKIWGLHRLRSQTVSKLSHFLQKKYDASGEPAVACLVFDSLGLWCAPITHEGNLAGYLVVSHLPTDASMRYLKPFSSLSKITSEACWRQLEIERLTATIRPRAIALSTVHTVHRIINSTLNLDELVSRLAHLTAQVLRVNRCAIYLLQTSRNGNPAAGSSPKKTLLVCKALVGYPKNVKQDRSVSIGRGLEGKIAKSADIQLRKKILCIPLIDEDVIGVVTVASKKDKSDFNQFDLEILTTLAEEAVIAIKNAQMYEEQRRVTLNTIQSLAVILGSRSPQNHATMTPETFAWLALKTGEGVGLSEEQLQGLHYAALLKETTKIGIPEEILKKPEKLTGEELLKLRNHPAHGATIVQKFESLKNVAPIILYSREKFDGTGYPDGLKGDTIPIGARILSVLNAFEAIVVGRPYRGKLSQEEAFEELTRNSGTQFDPRVVEAFLKIIRDQAIFRRVKQSLER